MVTVASRGGLRWKLLLLWQAKLLEPSDSTGFERAPREDQSEKWGVATS